MINLKSISLYSETKSTQGFTTLRLRSGFTIVELLVVIVVIGILASITVVSYTGVSQKATVTVLQADLANSKTSLLMYKSLHDSFPTSLDENNCPVLPVPDTNYCLKSSTNNTLSNYDSDGNTFALSVISTNDTIYSVSNDVPPQPGSNPIYLDPADWLTIGTQTWSKTNLNVGTMVTGATEQTNNSTIEKYCYDNNPTNCTTYGGLYQWNEAMNYEPTETAEGARGICPVGSHVPTDNDWKTLEMHLGMTQEQADAEFWRGTDQGTQLMVGGSSGLEMPFSGVRGVDGLFGEISSHGIFWSSTAFDTGTWTRHLLTFDIRSYRHLDGRGYGFSVRCIGN